MSLLSRFKKPLPLQSLRLRAFDRANSFGSLKHPPSTNFYGNVNQGLPDFLPPICLTDSAAMVRHGSPWFVDLPPVAP